MARAEVVITATDRTRNAIQSAQRNLGSLTKSAEAANAALKKIGAVVGVAALAAFVARVNNAADELQDMADKLGVSASSLSTLKLAAAQSGTSLDAVTGAIAKMSQNLGDAVGGSKQASEAFRKIGLDAKALAGLRPDEAFNKVSDAISKIENPYRRASAAQDIFGKGAREIQALLREGAAATRDAQAALEAHGAALSDLDIARIGVMNDDLAAQGTIIGNLATKMLSGFAPAVTVLGDAFDELTGSIGSANNAGRILGITFTGIIKFVQYVASLITAVFKGLQSAVLAVSVYILSSIQRMVEGFARLLSAVESVVGGNMAPRIFAARDALQSMMESLASMSETALQGATSALMDTGRFANELANAAGIFDAAAQRMDASARKRIGAGQSPMGAGDVGGGQAGAATDSAMEKIASKARAAREKRFNEYFVDLEKFLRSAAAELPDGMQKALDIELSTIVSDSLKERIEGLNDAIQMSAYDMRNAFAQFLFDPFETGLRGMLSSFLNTIRRMAAELAANAIIKAIFTPLASQAGILGDIGSAFVAAATPRAVGGPVSKGASYLVGERGPELFVPNTSGGIVPNKALGGGGMTVAPVYNIDARGATMELTQALPTILADNNRRIFDELDRRYGIRR